MKKEGIFVPLILSEANFVNIFVLFQCTQALCTRVWQNASVNTLGHVMVCDVYFPFPKIL